jgi:phosphocarrier protein
LTGGELNYGAENLFRYFQGIPPLKTVTATVADPVGFHLRAAGRIVKLTKKFASEVTIRYNGRTANAKSIMGLASLAAEFGTDVVIEVEGSDEDEALGLLVQLIEVDLGIPEDQQ